jgi:HK97 family phage prohead protease
MSKPLEFKSFKFEIKTVDDAGAFEGYLAVFNNVDAGKDRIRKGAFTKTLAEHAVFPLLYVHKGMNIPVGDFSAQEDNFGLLLKGQLYLSDFEGQPLPEPRQLHMAMKRKAVTGLSIGYETIKAGRDGDVRDLLELRLGEGSVVPWPMNDLARISSVKGLVGTLSESQVRELIESLKALLPAEPPDTGTPAASEPPSDSDLTPYIEAAKSAIKEMATTPKQESK